MPINLILDPQNRYVIYELSDPIDMRELNDAYAQELAYRDATQNTVHLLADLSQANRLPTNWLSAQATPGLKHPRSGEMLLVGLSGTVRMAVEVVMKVSRFDRVRFFNTREEAEARLQELLG
jgi:ornithine cyclodeaminase/alanine dehydrogenase-like protein (mu-crystallin family)